jgi:alpha-D-xyloside xylohydrolase
MTLLNQPLDISDDFYDTQHEYYLAGPVTHFDAASGEGRIRWYYHRWVHDWSFMKIGTHLKKFDEKEIFWHDQAVHPELYFSISFINDRCFRLRMKTTDTAQAVYPSLMLQQEPSTVGNWTISDAKEKIIYSGEAGSVSIDKTNWKLEIFDKTGELLTATQGMEVLDALHHKNIPFLFTRRATDLSRSVAASFSLAPGEKIYGGGESFTALNKRGQKLVLYTSDVQSAGTNGQYKPVPFVMSSRGYGLFVHTSTPVTLDIGHRFDGTHTVFAGDDQLDLFFFIGNPKEVLTEYTALTGRSPLPPLWSFGLWMGRFSYRSQQEVNEVAARLREYEVPCDVIHIDAGWFEHSIHCDFRFSPKTFPDPKEMISALRKNGFRVSLWQIPYLTPKNPLFEEVVAKKLFIKDGNGNVPTEDAVLDFSNPEAAAWYESKVKTLLGLGVSVIKADFGESAPLRAAYSSGRSGFYEHNLYPLRYTQLVHDITQKATGESITWARSAWAGGQRYPIHWSGDPEVSDVAMASTLRAGLSLGLCGFSFWSHDIGGFMAAPEEKLYARWALFGLLTSHSRVHGFPPREPWSFSDEFLQAFRSITELKYRLMPYIYTQAAICAKNGWPMLQALLFQYPEDPAAWLVEDQYLFGEQMMVAPLFDNKSGRHVYLPAGKWVDYQTKKIFDGSQWHFIEAGELPGIILVKYGSLIPHINLALSTDDMNWEEIELKAFSSGDMPAVTDFYFPDTGTMVKLDAVYKDGSWKLIDKGNHSGKTRFTINAF